MRTGRRLLRRSTLGAAAMTTLALGVGIAWAAPADLDTSFSQDGWTAIDSGDLERARATALQPDGKIVVAGATTVGGNAAVYRLTPGGSLDPTFDGDGAKGIDSGGIESASAVALQPDGKIVVAGSTTVGGNVAVYRLTPGGALDPTFDGDGAKGIDSGGIEKAAAVAVQSDGKILVAGSTTVGHDAVVYRLTRTGALDATFDGDGAVGIDSGGTEVAQALALQPDGKIVVAGSSTVNGDATVYRLNPGGRLDRTFDGDGAVGINSGGTEAATAVALQPDGKIVVAGWTSVAENAAVYRLMPGGSLDPTFDGDGAVGLDSGAVEVGLALAIQANGKILVAGETTDGDDGIIFRLTPTGKRDRRFDSEGELHLQAGGITNASALALQPNGRIVVAGGNGPDAVVLRLKGDRVG